MCNKNIIVYDPYLKRLENTTEDMANKLIRKHKAYKQEDGSIIIFFDKSLRKQLKEELLLINNTCYICGRQFDNLTLEHVVSVAGGGLDEDINLKLACSDCNTYKGTSSLESFIKTIKLFRDKFSYISEERIEYLERTYIIESGKNKTGFYRKKNNNFRYTKKGNRRKH